MPRLSFVVSAPSGAGKTTLAAELLVRVDALTRVVTWTTRAPRPGERDGVDYAFVSAADFDRCEAAQGFLESAVVYGSRYGTPRSEVERIHALGHDALMVIDVQGAEAVRQRLRDAITVFVLPPSRAALQARLHERDGSHRHTAGAIETRLLAAADEIARFVSYDYVVVNDDMEEAVADLVAVVRAERVRNHRRRATGERILTSFREAKLERT